MTLPSAERLTALTTPRSGAVEDDKPSSFLFGVPSFESHSSYPRGTIELDRLVPNSAIFNIF